MELWNEEQKEKALLEKIKKEKRKRIIKYASVLVFLLTATFTYFVTAKGFDYVKDNILGHPTKELMEGEWIYSEYGNPGVRLETPKVLKRMDAKNGSVSTCRWDETRRGWTKTRAESSTKR